MHRQVREHLEDVLTEPGATSGANPAVEAETHLAECHECKDEVSAMREQAAMLRQLRAPARDREGREVAPRAGFYARVMERIEAEGPGSIWSLFFDSVFGRRLALASLALAVLLAVCLFSAERFSTADEPQIAQQPQPVQMMPDLGGQPVFGTAIAGQPLPGEDRPGAVLTGDVDDDSVLVNLVTYREQ